MTGLAEELLLLALDDEKGKVSMNASTTLDTALAGAHLIELVETGRLNMQDEKHVEVLDESPTGDGALDVSLVTVAEARSRKVSSLIPKMTKGLRNRLLAQLVGQGALREEKSKVLGLFTRTSYPEQDGAAEAAVRRRLRAAILEDAPGDGRIAALAAIIEAADLEWLILDRQERKASKGRMKELAAGENLNPAISSAVDSVNAAAMAAIVAATASSAAACSAASSSSSC